MFPFTSATERGRGVAREGEPGNVQRKEKRNKKWNTSCLYFVFVRTIQGLAHKNHIQCEYNFSRFSFRLPILFIFAFASFHRLVAVYVPANGEERKEPEMNTQN